MKNNLLFTLITIVVLLSFPKVNFGQAPNLGTAYSFALFTGSGAFNNTNATSVVTGDVGNYTGAFNAFPPGILIGTKHVGDGTAFTAAADVLTAYNNLAGRTGSTVISTTLDGQVLTPGLYSTGAASTLNTTLTLNGAGIYIIQIDGALTLAASSAIIVSGGASVCDVYWQINGEVNLGASSVFRGTIVASGAINLLAGSTLYGRGLSTTGAISTAANTVTNPCVCSLGADAVPNNPLCYGTANGGFTITAIGGTGTLQYSKDGGTTWVASGVFTGLAAGTFNWAVMDAINCTTTGTVTVTIPPDITATDAHTDVKCFGGNDGTLTVTFSGGTPPYMVNFNGGGFVTQTSPKVYSGLTAGTYTWIVQDANLCQKSGSEIIIQPADILATDAHTDVKCFGGNDGSVTVTFSGGTPPYMINFNGGGFVTQTSPKIYSGLIAGTYTWIVRDANLCEKSGSEVIIQPVDILATDAHTDVNCFGGNNGTVTITFSGGTPPYMINFNGGGFVSQTSPKIYSGLIAGTYTWVVQDANLCQKSGSEIIIQPADIIASSAHTNVLCGGNDGTVTVNFSGGTPPYMVNFNGGGFVTQTSPKIYSGLIAGTYTWVVQDANLCQKSGSEVVGQSADIIAADAHTDVKCFGGNDGTVTVTFSGGTSPYQVNFNGGGFVTQTSPKIYTGLIAGTYTWVVQDANLCQKSGSEIIIQPAEILATDAHTDVKCFGGNDGTVTITFSGGTGPYLVNFNGGGFVAQTSPKIYSGLTAGTYNWIVQDANLCQKSGSEVIIQPADIIATSSHTNVLCGGNDGTVTVNFSGGTPPYMISFNGGGFVTQTSPKIYSGLIAGTYTWVVRDANLCEKSGSEVIGQSANIIATDAHTDVKCFGGNDGTVTITFSGGTGPYQVNFNGGGFLTQTSPKIYSGLIAGTYTWIVQDANLCQQSGSEVVGQPIDIIATDAHTDVKCFGGNDGTVTVTFTGGTPPYMVNFNGGGFVTQTSPKIYSGLIAGTYTWIVQDANLCQKSGSEVIIQPSDIIATDAHTDVKCFGGNDGTVTVTFTGGTPPYMINFNGGGFVTQTSPKIYSGLTAGTYTWVVRDANLCEKSGSEVIIQPSNIIAADAHTDVKCFGGSDGTITVTFTGGTPPYMVNFNGGGFISQTSPKIYTGLIAGTYSWIVQDANLCQQSGSEVVGQPVDILATDTHTDVKCFGGNDGTVTVTFAGGTPPYMINFNGGGFVTQTSPKIYSGLIAGTYTWIVRDANLCQKSGSEIVVQPADIIATDAHTNVLCGGNNGTVTINFSGGTPPYMINFNGGGFVTQIAPKIYSGLTAGTYTWVVQDANLCQKSGSEIVEPSIGVTATSAHTDVKCFGGNDGTLTVTFSGGTPPYMVNFNGGGFVSQTSPKIYTGLVAGTYTWIVQDATLCQQSGSELVGQPLDILATGAHNNVKCFGGSDGSVTITFSGGTPPYMVNFNGGGFVTQTSPKIYSGLIAGTYTWIVQDANLCQKSGSEVVGQPTDIIATGAHTDVKCFGGNDGTITLTFDGGTGHYKVNFNGSGFVKQTSPIIYSGLTAGTYTWIVQDATLCQKSGSIVVGQPSDITVTGAHTNVLCGGNNGTVTLTFSGGTSPYKVNFNGGGFVTQTSPKIYSGLIAGTYTWIVEDANLCQKSGSEIVGQPANIIAASAHADATCGGNNGTVTVTFSGGTPPYMVNFNGGGFSTQTSPKIYSGLTAGTYTWIVQDANLCQQFGSEIVGQTANIIAASAHTDVKCFGGSDGTITLTFSGETPPYMINFNGGGFVTQTSPKIYSGLKAGTYTWIVQDVNLCQKSGSEVVGQPADITASSAATDVKCLGGSDGTVTITFDGGTGPYMVNFNGGGFVTQTSPKIYSGLTAGTYTWIVQDANLCQKSGSEIIGQPIDIIATDTHTNVKCFGGSDGTVTITFVGGTGPYMINFNGGGFVTQTSPKIYSGLIAGTYTWIVQDANLCQKSGSEIVVQPADIIATDAHTNVLCGGNDGTVTVNFSGGTPPYMVNFNGGGFVTQTSPKIYSGLTADTYTWIVQDANLCQKSGSEIVGQSTGITAIGAHTDVKCFGGNDGTLTVTFSGGTPPYQVNFNGGGFVTQTSPKIYSGLTAGTYTWIVQDANLCQLSGSEVVGQPVDILATDAHSDVKCLGGNDGSVTVTFTGGTPPYMINFNGGGFVTQTSPKIYSGLTAGTYTWVVRDANLCEKSGSEVILQPVDIIATDAHTNVLCGGNDGTVTIAFSGGTPPYMVNFNGGGFVTQTSPKIYSGLTAGTYTWIVRDADLCEKSGSEVVGQSADILATDAHSNVKCFGGNDGTITITFSGGTPPYMVNFNGGGFVTQTSPKIYSGLVAGTYTWIVQDANQCQQSGSEVVGQPVDILATDAHSDVKCLGGNDGTLTVTFSGGTPPYMINFNGGGFVTQTSPKIYSGLIAGTYTWIVQDANLCQKSGSEIIVQPSDIIATDAHTNVLCGGNDGTVTVNFSGGTPPYMVSFNGGGFVTQTSPKIYGGLTAGTYTWVVRDANLCEKSGSEVIAQSANILATDTHTDVKCYGGNDGTVTITFSNGTPPYMVNFNGGGFVIQSSPKIYSGLTAGTYTWIVQDANLCEQSGSEVVGQPVDILATDAHTDIKCFGGNDGTVTVIFTGGTPPYMVNFNGGGFVTQTSPKIYSGLTAGTYTWVVRDANLCEKSGSEVIIQPVDIIATDAHTNVLCGGNDGTVTVNFSGGTPPYMVNFNGGGFVAQTSPKIYSSLIAGTYTWVVRDANLCEKSGSEAVGQSASIIATDAHTDVKCFGGNDGTVTITFGGGTGPYLVNFNGGGFVAQTSPKIYTGLVAGTYTWIVQDATLCEQSGSEVVGQPVDILATDAHTDIKCIGANDGTVTVTFTGGTPPYMVNFNGGGFVTQTSPKIYSGLIAGTYNWVVRDANLCEKSGSEVIIQPVDISASGVHTNVVCGGNDGTVTINFNGGKPPYMISFNGGGFVAQTSPKVYSSLTAGTYSWIVRDVNLCEISGSEVVGQSAEVTATDAHTDVKCFGGNDGTITVTFSGGTSPFKVNFNGGGFVTQTSPKVYSSLTAGTYTWIVQDANLCEKSGSEVVGQSVDILATDAHTNVKCFGDNDGTVTVNFSSGTPPYMINFNGGGFITQTSPKIYTGLIPGTYTWVVRDANLCEKSGSEVVGQSAEITATDAHNDVKCFGGNDGTVTVTFSSGTPPYMVNFNGGGFVTQTSPKIYSGLTAGTYTWVVRDANLCQQSGSEVVGQPVDIIATDAHTDVKCFGGNDGTVTVNVSGGTPPYMINFNGGGFVTQTSPKIYSGLTAGTYTWVVRDANLCEKSGSEVVGQSIEITATDAHTNVKCFGGNDGTVTVTFSGETPPYLVNFNGGGFVAQTSPKIYTGLVAGTYTWIVQDANQCQKSGSETVSQADALDLILTPTNATCFGGNMSISVAITGAPLSDLQIKFDAGSWAGVSATPVVFNTLIPGSHIVTLRRISDNNCQVTKSATVIQPDALDLTLTPINANCFGDNKSISAVITGTPLSDLQIRLDAGSWAAVTATPVLFSNLSVGSHTVALRRISDNTCTVNKSASVSQPEVLSCNIADILPAVCLSNDGSATVTATGGIPPYSYLWDNGQITATATMLSKGMHSVTVTDKNLCTTKCEAEIPNTPCVFCTYTQGKYGNQDKSSSYMPGFGNIPTSQMVTNLLAQGDMKIGAGSNYILFKAGDAEVINSIMPGGSSCSTLSGICIPEGKVASCLNPYLTKQGRLNSGLISQTLALGLNLRLNKDLEILPLDAGYIKLPAGVLCCMSSKGYNVTVGGLFKLANDALGKVISFPITITCDSKSYTVSYCDIVSAIDPINNAFDECKILVLNTDVKSLSGPGRVKVAQTLLDNQGTTSLKVYPNPFSDKLIFEFTSETRANALLEVYNMLGQKLSILMNQTVEEGVLNRIEYKPIGLVPGIFYYRLNLDGNIRTGKVVYFKKE